MQAFDYYYYVTCHSEVEDSKINFVSVDLLVFTIKNVFYRSRYVVHALHFFSVVLCIKTVLGFNLITATRTY